MARLRRRTGARMVVVEVWGGRNPRARELWGRGRREGRSTPTHRTREGSYNPSGGGSGGRAGIELDAEADDLLAGLREKLALLAVKERARRAEAHDRGRGGEERHEVVARGGAGNLPRAAKAWAGSRGTSTSAVRERGGGKGRRRDDE